MAQAYVAAAGKGKPDRVERGSAEALPFEAESFDVVVLEQVLEHLADPARGLREARRVLRTGGIVCVGVPDAARYAERRFFDYYWLLLREHIQHFDVHHLDWCAARAGLEPAGHRHGAHAVMGEKMVMPNLYAIYHWSGSAAAAAAPGPDLGKLEPQMLEYLREESARQEEKSLRIAGLAASRRPVYAWGVGREFLYLYESAGLKDCTLAGLIDMNPRKRKVGSVGGMRIGDEGLLREAPAGSWLLITAVAHADVIARRARVLGFRGEWFDLKATAAPPRG
jgi:hypothetical protein